MKKSDRLLIGLFLLALLVIAFANLALYGEYRKGRVTSIDDLLARNLTTTQLGPVRHLSLNSNFWVNVIPSDSNYLEYPREVPESRGNYLTQLRQSGDTLFLGGTSVMPIHRAFADWSYRHSIPPVNIHLKDLRSVDITNGQVYLVGTPVPQLSTIKITAKGSSVWIGGYTEPDQQLQKKEYFDSLDLRLDNTILLLNRPAVIQKLHARLDSSAEINDRIATLGAADISPGPDSRISMTGTNALKTTINVH